MSNSKNTNYNSELNSIRDSILSFLGSVGRNNGNMDQVNELVQVPLQDLDQFIITYFGEEALHKIEPQLTRYKLLTDPDYLPAAATAPTTTATATEDVE